MVSQRQTAIDRLKAWAQGVKRDVIALWLAARDRRVPWHAKALAGLVAAYALSPIDLIPDFIPVLGYLDDLVIVPLGILLVVRLIPESIMKELRMRAAGLAKPSSRAGLTIVIAVWAVGAIFVTWRLWFHTETGRS